MRRSLTKREKAAMIEAQDGKCGCGCGDPVTMETGEGEHGVPVALGNCKKPDAIFLVGCHRRKSLSDLKMIAKAKRMRLKHLTGRGRARKGRPLKSRGFDKRFKRKMSGEVVRA